VNVEILDISMPLAGGTAPWPGDQPFELRWTLQQERGDSVNVAAITMSVHVGTHTDGGFHVAADGSRAAQLPLAAYIGPVLVVDARGRQQLDEHVLDDVELGDIRRILFRTRDTVDVNTFPRHFLSPTQGLARRLVADGVRLIGTDAPSMDHAESKTLDSHHILVQGGVAILENLVLQDVEPGVYTLIALPLKLMEADSSPVRAVLVRGDMPQLS
jgi:arylformamidase